MENLAAKFGKKLREKRKETKISQDDLALKSGIDRSYVGRIERGEVNVTLDKVYRLSEILDCDVKELLP